MSYPPAALSRRASLCYWASPPHVIAFRGIAALVAGSTLAATVAVAGPIDLVERGRVAYLRYCASCHGVRGEGDGPVARALVVRPPDLRGLSRRWGAPLDRARLQSTIDGRTPIVAHGEREMPVWGERFDLPPDDVSRERTIAERVAELHAYLESIQRDR